MSGDEDKILAVVEASGAEEPETVDAAAAVAATATVAPGANKITSLKERKAPCAWSSHPTTGGTTS